MSKIKDYSRAQFIYKPSFTSHDNNSGNAFWKKNSITYFSILDSSFCKLMWIESNSWARVLSACLSVFILDRMVSSQNQWILTLVGRSSSSIRSQISFNLNYLRMQCHCHFCYVHSFNNFILWTEFITWNCSMFCICCRVRGGSKNFCMWFFDILFSVIFYPVQ